MPRCDAVIVSDYGYGVLTPRVIEVIQQLQAKSPCTLLVDSKRQLTAFQRVRATAVKPNYAEVAKVYVTVPGGRREGFTFRPKLLGGFAGVRNADCRKDH